MKFNELNVTKQKSASRKGRGIAAGQGKTAGRGTKGQNARKSGGVRPGFEGGQTPVMQRLPKLRGFRSHISPAYEVHTSHLNDLGATVDNKTVFDAGLVPSAFAKVKVIANGELTKKVAVKLQAATKGAQAQIKKAGGSFEAVAQPQRTAAKKTTKSDK